MGGAGARELPRRPLPLTITHTKGSTSTMVSNHNPSRPPHWPPGALQASAREVHSPTPTASGEALPELTPWELQAIWLPVGPQNHFFPAGKPRSGCSKYMKPRDVVLRTRKTSSGKTFVTARPPTLKVGKVMDKGDKNLTRCAACGYVAAKTGAKLVLPHVTRPLRALWENPVGTSFSHYFAAGSGVSSCGNWERSNSNHEQGQRKICGSCVVEHQVGEAPK